METPTVTLQDLADFLLALPDNAPIRMSCGEYRNPIGCLMTQYGKNKGWVFEYSYSDGIWEDKNYNVVARLDSNYGGVFELFHDSDGGEETRYTTKPWKDLLKDKFKNK